MVSRGMDRPLPGVNLTWRQLGGLTGIIGVVLFVIGVLMQIDAPTLDDSATEASAWFKENANQYLTGDLLISIGIVVFLIPFFVALKDLLAQAEGPAGSWSWVNLVGALVFILVGAASSMFYGALAVAPDDITDAGVVKALQAGNFYGFGGIGLALVPFFLGASLVILRTRVSWAWLGWAGLALALVSLLSAGAPLAGPGGFFDVMGMISSTGLGVWILVMGGAMLMKGAST